MLHVSCPSCKSKVYVYYNKCFSCGRQFSHDEIKDNIQKAKKKYKKTKSLEAIKVVFSFQQILARFGVPLSAVEIADHVGAVAIKSRDDIFNGMFSFSLTTILGLSASVFIYKRYVARLSDAKLNDRAVRKDLLLLMAAFGCAIISFVEIISHVLGIKSDSHFSIFQLIFFQILNYFLIMIIIAIVLNLRPFFRRIRSSIDPEHQYDFEA